MKKLSKQAEDRLLLAIEKTAMVINDSELDPSEAIAKVANEMGVPPGHINLLVHAYNTGRTTRQRLDGNNALERAAEFPLADASRVLELMFPDTVKTASQNRREAAISFEYTIPPSGMLRRREKRALLANKVDWRLCEKPPEYPCDPMAAMRKAYGEAERLHRKIAEARREMAHARDKMASTFMALTDYFRQPDAIPIRDCKEQLTIMYGNKGGQIIDEIVNVTPGLLKLSQHKRADNRARLEPVDGEPYAIVSQLLDELDEYKTKKSNYETIRKTAGEQAEAAIRPFGQPEPQSVLEGFPSSTELEKTADSFLAPLAAASMLKNILSTGQPAQRATPSIVDTIDPEHDQQLRAIRTQTMLQDFMLNDPVISESDPEDIVSAYNEIVQIAPRAADKRLLVQTLLRRRLAQGTLDPFEIESLIGAETQQKRLAEPFAMRNWQVQPKPTN